MQATQAEASEVAILTRIFRAGSPTFSPVMAREILSLDFDQVDKDRIKDLAAKARAGTLTEAEDFEAGRYEMVGHLLGILKSKARRSLASSRDEGEPRAS